MQDYEDKAAEASENLLLSVDRWANVTLLLGNVGETVSQHAGRMAAAGAWEWCLFCRLLSILVERNHCAKSIDPSSPPSPPIVYARAGICFLALLLVAWTIVWSCVKGLIGLLFAA